MERKLVSYDYKLNETLALLVKPGLLLASTKPFGASNVMTIGWGSVGIMWGRPMFTVMVRPSRYTYGFIEEAGVFTVNVPTLALSAWVGVCGSRSGRDLDKFGAYGITTSMGQNVKAVTIDACPLVYECRVVHVNDIIPANLDKAFEARAYAGSNYHRYYYGEILGAYAATGY
jgi:flavin reductase (DIM6/NTAB) family NADH-FMN oxidoreductase RutF